MYLEVGDIIVYRGLIWGTGKTFSDNINCINYYEHLGEIQIVGVTSKNNLLGNIMGYSFVEKENIKETAFDIIIVMADKCVFQEIRGEAMRIGIPDSVVISYKIFRLPKINIKKYLEIKKNPPTIFVNNCWGGLTYHQLGLEFYSPFINMFESDVDYLKFLHNPRKYIDSQLEYIEDEYEVNLKRMYPVCKCDDIILHFNHYLSFEEANRCWERRKSRINWDNLFVAMITSNEESAISFSKLQYMKKICFVPFDLKMPSLECINLNFNTDNSSNTFKSIINGMAIGTNLYYDPVELLNSGNIKRL
ncbi:MAG: hypothetical protein BHW48_03045 [Roseburia sp. CAG:10041_57]|nr:MAG: hypothetical protein BHW48_03045 [Roseburia sp. CAG:10041_57]